MISWLMNSWLHKLFSVSEITSQPLEIRSCFSHHKEVSKQTSLHLIIFNDALAVYWIFCITAVAIKYNCWGATRGGGLYGMEIKEIYRAWTQWFHKDFKLQDLIIKKLSFEKFWNSIMQRKFFLPPSKNTQVAPLDKWYLIG